tara:strand:- start:83 stop:529 length:447 start_codon:yes stop_codon:yes gene_type:complete
LFEDKEVKKYLLILLLLVTPVSFAENSSLNLNIPNTSRSFQQDRIRAGNVDCSMAIGSSTSLEFGVVGILNQNQPFDNIVGLPNRDGYDNNDFVRDIGVYGKIHVPIGAPKERINCNKLYKIQLQIKELELQKLRQELVNLRQLQFEN